MIMFLADRFESKIRPPSPRNQYHRSVSGAV